MAAKSIKIISIVALGLAFGQGSAQDVAADDQERNIRLNILQLPAGFLNMAYEKSLDKHSSYKIDLLVSPWKSYLNHPKDCIINLLKPPELFYCLSSTICSVILLYYLPILLFTISSYYFKKH